jgi:hypothetical protein
LKKSPLRQVFLRRFFVFGEWCHDRTMTEAKAVEMGHEHRPEETGSPGPTPPSGDAMPAGGGHTGKIDRLPAAIRLELNQRLRHGEPGKELVQWLNGLAEVQAVMAAQFHGQPISEMNVSRWKQGGHQIWLEEQRALTAVAALLEQSAALQAAAKDGLADGMALVLASKMALEIQRLGSVPDGEEKSRTWRQLLASVALLRRGDLQGERILVEREKLGFRRELHQKEQEAQFFKWVEKPEHRGQILDRLLTPEQKATETKRRKAERVRRVKEALGVK